MIQYPEVYENLIKLSPFEERFRDYYLTHGHSCSTENIEKLLHGDDMAQWGIKKRSENHAYSFELVEEDYFSKESDIVILKNLRYTAVGEHQHTFFEIMYLLSGECTNNVDNSLILMKKGDFCIIPPQVPHSIRVESDSVLLNILVRTSTFTDAFLPLLRSGNILSDFFNEILYSSNYKKYLLFHTGEDYQVLNYVLQMYKEQSGQKKYCGSIMNGLLMAVSGKLLQLHENDVEYPAKYVEKYDKIPRILAYIKKHCQTVTLKECAEHFHFNSQYLSSLLKKHTNRTFSAVLTEERMKVAAEMLGKTDKPVKEIALAAGYQDEAYFMKVFKKYFGCTPSDFRGESMNR